MWETYAINSNSVKVNTDISLNCLQMSDYNKLIPYNHIYWEVFIGILLKRLKSVWVLKNK